LPPIALRAWLAEFGGPQAVLNQPFNALAALAGARAALAVLGFLAALGTRFLRRMPCAHA
jgi:hypothetical protein